LLLRENRLSDTPTLPPRRDRHFAEYIATAVALVISAVSLWVAIGTEDANRKMVAAASLPLLQSETSDGDTAGHSVITYGISNAGIGPALVETFEVFFRGKPVRSATELLQACCHYREGAVTWTNATMTGLVLRAGDSRTFIYYPKGTQNLQSYTEFDAARGRLITERVCYCSVFNECWLSDLNTLHPPRVDKCPVPKVAYSTSR
jgi:hypothetical protein